MRPSGRSGASRNEPRWRRSTRSRCDLRRRLRRRLQEARAQPVPPSELTSRLSRVRHNRSREPSVGEQEGEISPEELLEHIRQMKVSDVLLSILPTIAQLGYAKLEPDGRDLEQARLAIESLRALMPVLAGSVPEEVLHDFEQASANQPIMLSLEPLLSTGVAAVGRRAVA